ncbi:unnamed protein product [Blepharisma stoltei]|uniref:Uncharacterized protein n=1 Tax=Blepharisma stoltei TaxID=1481888 RepID=A0AAU9JEL1_9CILI|nr:unnamed protein product [Blepharisma stoltei]
MLFSRNPRFRTLSKIYGFFIIIGSGTTHWFKDNSNSLASQAKYQYKLWTENNSILHQWMKAYQSPPRSFIKTASPDLLKAQEASRQKYINKHHLIDEEEFTRMKLWNSFWKYDTKN